MDFFRTLETLARVDTLAQVIEDVVEKLPDQLPVDFYNQLKSEQVVVEDVFRTFCETHGFEFHNVEDLAIAVDGLELVSFHGDWPSFLCELFITLKRRRAPTRVLMCLKKILQDYVLVKGATEEDFQALIGTTVSQLIGDMQTACQQVAVMTGAQYVETSGIVENVAKPVISLSTQVDSVRALNSLRKQREADSPTVRHLKARCDVYNTGARTDDKFSGIVPPENTVLHLGSGVSGSLSSTVLGKHVQLCDPIIGTDHTTYDYYNYDYVVSDACKYDDKGLDGKATNELNNEIFLLAQEASNNNVYVKHCLFQPTISTYRAVPVRKTRAHNIEIIVKCHNIDCTCGECYDTDHLSIAFAQPVYNINTARAKLSKIRLGNTRRHVAQKHFRVFRVKRRLPIMSGRYKYYPFIKRPLDTFRRLSLTQFRAAYGQREMDSSFAIGFKPCEVLQMLMRTYDLMDSLQRLCHLSEKLGWSERDLVLF